MPRKEHKDVYKRQVYDPTREHYRNTRTVRWTDKGLWEHSEQLAMKTLTDVTPYTLSLIHI